VGFNFGVGTIGLRAQKDYTRMLKRWRFRGWGSGGWGGV
jgi:hypothetical protein